MKTNNYSTFFPIVEKVFKDLEISDLCKLIFYDIAYFCTMKDKVCFATNYHFAHKFGKNESTISKAITTLYRKGYIDRFIDRNKNRKIYVQLSKFKGDVDKPMNGRSDNENMHWRDNTINVSNSIDREKPYKNPLLVKKSGKPSILRGEILSCVSSQLKTENPLEEMKEAVEFLLEKYSDYNLSKIVRILIQQIAEKNLPLMQGNIKKFYDSRLELLVLSINKGESGSIPTGTSKTNYPTKLAEYLILYVYDLIKEIERESRLVNKTEDPGLYEIASDTYEILWHELSDGERLTLKGRLIEVNEIKGTDPNLPFANLKLINEENQEIIVQAGSKNYNLYKANIQISKGEQVAVHGLVKFNKRHDQNIISLYEIELKTNERLNEAI